jgi:hypothetical protein
MGPPSYMRSVVDRNVVTRRVPVLGEKPVPLSVCLLQILHGLAWVRSLGFRGDRPANNRPFDGTATGVFPEGVNMWVDHWQCCLLKPSSFYFEFLTDIPLVFTILRTDFTTVHWQFFSDDCSLTPTTVCLFILTTVSTNKQFLHLHLAY